MHKKTDDLSPNFCYTLPQIEAPIISPNPTPIKAIKQFLLLKEKFWSESWKVQNIRGTKIPAYVPTPLTAVHIISGHNFTILSEIISYFVAFISSVMFESFSNYSGFSGEVKTAKQTVAITARQLMVI